MGKHKKSKKPNWTAYVVKSLHEWSGYVMQANMPRDTIYCIADMDSSLFACGVNHIINRREGVLLQYKNKPAVSYYKYVFPFSPPIGDVASRFLHVQGGSICPPFKKRIKWNAPVLSFWPFYQATTSGIKASPYAVATDRDQAWDSYIIALNSLLPIEVNGFNVHMTPKEVEAHMRERLDGYDIPDFGSIAELPPLQKKMPQAFQEAMEKVGYEKFHLYGFDPTPEATVRAMVVYNEETKQHTVEYMKDPSEYKNMAHSLLASRGITWERG